MECNRTSELLPWFANRSLSADEAAAVEAHLADCQSCRRELEEVGAAWEVFEQHLPASTLVELAFGAGGDGGSQAVSTERAERHLELCRACAEELEMVRESRSELDRVELERSELEGSEREGYAAGGRGESASGAWQTGGATVAAFPRPGAAAEGWRRLAIAASLAAVVTSAGWLWTAQDRGAPTFRGGEAPIAEAEPVEEPATRPSLAERLAGAERPNPNVPVVTARPGDASGGIEPARLPAGSAAVVLVLRGASAPEGAVSGRLEGPAGEPVWSLDGLTAGADGSYTLSFSTLELEPGRYRLALLDATGAEVASYPLVAERGSG